MKKNTYILAFVTVSSKKEAKEIANVLVKDRLVACVNIVPGIVSVYTWQGKKEKSNEVLLIIKSRKTLFKKLARKVKQLHSYDVPEVISIPILDGNKDYLHWIRQNTGQ